MIVYWDMDGVLADLGAAISAHSGKRKEDLEKNLHSDHDAYMVYRTEVGIYRCFREITPLKKEAWRSLMVKTHGLGYTHEILTSYGVQEPLEMGDEAHRGKADFLREHYGDLFELGVISRFNGVSNGRQKAFYANGDQTLLIDDWEKNVEGFRKRGGLAVHYNVLRHDECYEEILSHLSEAPQGELW